MAAPAVWIGVLVDLVSKQQTTVLEVTHQCLVGRFEEHPTDQVEVGLEGAVGPDRVDHGKVVGAANRHVVGTKSRGLVDQTGAVLDGDVIGEHDEVGRLVEGHQFEGALIGPAFHLAALEPFTGDLPPLTECPLDQGFGHDETLLAVGGDHVLHVRVHGHRCVGHQGPRGGGPHQERGGVLR